MVMNEAERVTIRLELSKLADTVRQAYATNDADLYLSAFDVNAVVSMPNVSPIQGHEVLRDAFEQRPALPPGATFTVEPLEIEPLSPDWAYAFGTDTLRFADGKKQTMTFLVLIKRTSEGWKTFREVLSADQPGGRSES